MAYKGNMPNPTSRRAGSSKPRSSSKSSSKPASKPKVAYGPRTTY